MTNKACNSHIGVFDPATPEQILLQWLAEIKRFHTFYHKVSELLLAKGVWEVSSPYPSKCIGQCPLAQLITLQQTMQTELGTLLADTEHWPHSSAASSPNAHQQLATHGQLLKQLNQRAQSSLQLATALPN